MNDLVLEEECILVGILFKQMVLKPSIVKQLAVKVNTYSSSKTFLLVFIRMVLVYSHRVLVMLIQRIN
jgi:hypothetical protein